jgi:hypothetical protein
MILDGALQFTGTAGSTTANTDSPTTGTQQSTNTIDLLNARDLGIGDDPALKLLIECITTFTVGTSLDIQLQGSPDNTTWTVMWDSGVILEASLVAGVYLANVDLPRIVRPTPLAPTAAQALPRYLRLNYVNGAGTHTTGSIAGYLVLDRMDQISYPPGVVIAN